MKNLFMIALVLWSAAIAKANDENKKEKLILEPVYDSIRIYSDTSYADLSILISPREIDSISQYLNRNKLLSLDEVPYIEYNGKFVDKTIGDYDLEKKQLRRFLDLAYKHRDQGNYQDGLTLAMISVRKSFIIRDYISSYKAYNILASLYRHMYKYDFCISAYNQGLMALKSKSIQNIKDLDKGKISKEECEKRNNEINDMIAKVYSNIVAMYIEIEDFSKAQLAYNYANSVKQQKATYYELINRAGISYQGSISHLKALSLFEEVYKNTSDNDLKANAYKNAAFSLFILEKHKRAFKFIEKALKVAESEEVKIEITRNHYRILFNEVLAKKNPVKLNQRPSQDYTKALNNLKQKYLELQKETGSDIIEIYVNLGRIERELQNYKGENSAEYYFQKAIKLFEQNGDKRNKERARAYLGNLWTEIGEFDKAEMIFLDILKNGGHRPGGKSHTETLVYLGKLYTEINNKSYAFHYFNQANNNINALTNEYALIVSHGLRDCHISGTPVPEFFDRFKETTTLTKQIASLNAIIDSKEKAINEQSAILNKSKNWLAKSGIVGVLSALFVLIIIVSITPIAVRLYHQRKSIENDIIRVREAYRKIVNDRLAIKLSEHNIELKREIKSEKVKLIKKLTKNKKLEEFEKNWDNILLELANKQLKKNSIESIESLPNLKSFYAPSGDLWGMKIIKKSA